MSIDQGQRQFSLAENVIVSQPLMVEWVMVIIYRHRCHDHRQIFRVV